MLSRVVLGSLLLARAVHADPVEVDRVEAPPDQGEERADHNRIEATVSAGSHDTHRASVGGSTRRGTHRFEIDGAFDTTEHQNTNANVSTYSGRWTVTRPTVFLDVRALGERQRLKLERLGTSTAVPTSTQGLSATVGIRRFRAFGMDHQLLGGVGLVRAAGEMTDQFSGDEMPTHQSMIARKLRGEHRFLSAYIDDTVRFIRGLDITTGLVVEEWRNLGGDSTITYGSGPPMDVDSPDVASLLMSPTVSMTGHVSDDVTLVARSSRNLRAPTLTELYRPALIGDGLTAANPSLVPETVWTSELGPAYTTPRLAMRAAAFVSNIDNPITSVTLDATMEDGAIRERQNIDHARIAGVKTEASWRPAKLWLASAAYSYSRSQTDGGRELAQAPRHLASAMLTFDDPRVVTVTGAVRYAGGSFEDDRNTQRLGRTALVDAIAVRKIRGGLRGFVGVDNLFDRRYLVGRTAVDTLGAPRTFHLGVKIDSKRF